MRTRRSRDIGSPRQAGRNQVFSRKTTFGSITAQPFKEQPMVRRVLLLLALVTTGLAAQANHVTVIISSPTHSKYFLQRTLKDSAGADRFLLGHRILGGRETVRTEFDDAETLWIGAMDDSGRVHVEVLDGKRKKLTAEGAFVRVLRDNKDSSISIRANTVEPRLPFVVDEKPGARDSVTTVSVSRKPD
jgi:hypothetical protein